MKLAQRLVIGYYRTKIHTIGMVSASKAAQEAFQIFCTPYNKAERKKIPPIFKQAQAVSLTHDGKRVNGFRWQAPCPIGKKVLIVHGFSSQSFKFEKFVPLLLQEGFEVLAFDAPAHGLSEGKHINVVIYKQVILAIEAAFGPIEGFIAHSLGALATSLALEQLPSSHLRRAALIAPASETTRAVANFYKIFPLKAHIKQAFEEYLYQIGNNTMAYYSVNRAIQHIPHALLWVHDLQDTICPYQDTLPSRRANLPHVRFVDTNGLGHNKIYRDRAVMKQVVGFLKE